jgi:DNA processing protein
VSHGTENAALVALLRIGNRPWQSYAQLVEEAGSARDVLDSELSAVGSQPSLFGTDAGPDLGAVAADIAAWEARGMRLVTVLDAGYPENLRAVHDRPPLVFVAGRLRPADARSVAIVGARSSSPRGNDAAVAIAEHLVQNDYTVVSGLAAGIDTAAHTAALARGGRTIAVIGTGLGRTYPPQNAPLQRRIASECAVISQFWPDAPPTRRSFPMRNAVMSGVALATVVVEASLTSGARIQARLALAHGRPVFLLHGLLEHEWARELAARRGAYVVRVPDDVTAVVERLTGKTTLIA